jgi:hypothetical protein
MDGSERRWRASRSPRRRARVASGLGHCATYPSELGRKQIDEPQRSSVSKLKAMNQKGAETDLCLPSCFVEKRYRHLGF